jgi:hypothetical protein
MYPTGQTHSVPVPYAPTCIPTNPTAHQVKLPVRRPSSQRLTPTKPGAYDRDPLSTEKVSQHQAGPPGRFLVAVSVYDLVLGDRLTWNFNQHDLAAPYAMTLPQSHAYHLSITKPVQRCTCSMPMDCPRQRMIPVPPPWPLHEDY